MNPENPCQDVFCPYGRSVRMHINQNINKEDEMKKKSLRQYLLPAMLAGTLVVSGTGCGTDTDAGSTTTTSSSTSAQTTTAASASTQSAAPTVAEVEKGSGIEGYEAFADKVTLRIPVYDRGGEVDVEKNYWTDWVQKEFGDSYNVEVQYVAISRGDVLNAYANLANSGNLPTILMEYDFDKQAQWADDGYLQELDLDMLAEIAPTYYQNMVDAGNLNYSALNGTTYFALARRPYWNNDYNFATFYRADWVEEAGYDKLPDTYAEQLEMYKKFKEMGICEYPCNKDWRVTGAGVDQNYGFRDYPQDELEWATTGGYAIPALSTEATRRLIRRENEKYNLGLLDPEFYTREQTDSEADFVAGKKFMYTAYIAPNMPVLNDFYTQNPDAKLAIQVCPGLVVEEDGSSNAYRPNNSFGMMIGFSATASEDEIKAAMMYMEWVTQEENLFTFQYGIEGENFNYDENGLPILVSDYSGDKAMANTNKDYWCVTIESRNLDSIEDVVKLNYPAGYPDSDDFYNQILDNYKGKVAMEDSGYIQSDCNYAVAISALSEHQENLLGKYEEFRTKLTTCKPEEFDALYDDYSQQYLDAGYQDIIDERAEAYNSGMTSHLPK